MRRHATVGDLAAALRVARTGAQGQRKGKGKGVADALLRAMKVNLQMLGTIERIITQVQDRQGVDQGLHPPLFKQLAHDYRRLSRGMQKLGEADFSGNAEVEFYQWIDDDEDLPE